MKNNMRENKTPAIKRERTDKCWTKIDKQTQTNKQTMEIDGNHKRVFFCFVFYSLAEPNTKKKYSRNEGGERFPRLFFHFFFFFFVCLEDGAAHDDGRGLCRHEDGATSRGSLDGARAVGVAVAAAVVGVGVGVGGRGVDDAGGRGGGHGHAVGCALHHHGSVSPLDTALAAELVRVKRVAGAAGRAEEIGRHVLCLCVCVKMYMCVWKS